jgi:hypothetical protein
MYQWKVATLYSGNGGPECVDGKGGVMQAYWDDLELWTSFPPESLIESDVKSNSDITARLAGTGGVEFKLYLPRPQVFTFQLFDMSGSEIWYYKQSQAVSGAHRIFWHGRDNQLNRAANGIYYGLLSAEDVVKRTRLVFLP